MDFIRNSVYFQGFVGMVVIGVMVVMIVIVVETQNFASLPPSNETNGKIQCDLFTGEETSPLP